MIDRIAFLADAQKLVAKLEKDQRARCDDMPEVGKAVEAEYLRARDAGRTGQTLEEWRADAITQQAAAWVLSCVIVRFLEDNGLDRPAEAGRGPGERLGRATATSNRAVLPDPPARYRSRVPAGNLRRIGEAGRHPRPVRASTTLDPGDCRTGSRRTRPSDLILPFFQKIDAGSGDLVHDFTDAALDTRFLGDLYQDLSEAACKKYALLQTPVFVEEFTSSNALWNRQSRRSGLEQVRS